MRPEPIDSTQKLLSPPEILMLFLERYDTGEYPMQAQLAGLIAELGMDDAEAIQFGNTAFISHYDEEGTTVFMRALNVDTASNFVDNVENYVVHVYGRGVKTIFTNYSDATVSSVIKAVKKRVDENNPNLDAELEFDRDEGGEYVASIELKSERA